MQSPIRVLCIDDDPQIVDLVTDYLDGEFDDIRTRGETEPAVALERLREEPVDCVVSDFQMPEMDGLEVLAAARELDPGIPFILFTGKGNEAIASDAVSAGVTDYLRKTTGTEQYDLLANRIRNAVGRRRARTNYREVFDAADDAILVVDPERCTVIDAHATVDLWGYDVDEIVSKPVGALLEDDSMVHGTLEETVDESRTVDVEGVRADGSRFWAAVSLERATIEGRPRILAVVRDVTERHERERALRGLVAGQQELLAAESPEEIGATAARVAFESLGFEAATIYTREGDELEVLSAAGRPVPVADGRRERARAALAADDRRVQTTDVWRELHVPFGRRGVLVCVTAHPRSLAPHERSLACMLATCVDTTVDRNERKRQLKDRGEQLERRRDEFGTLDHINAVVRDVNKSLAQAASRDEIERLVCERLAASDSYRPAWIGRYDVETETVEPVATAGLTPEALAPVRFDGAASTPLATAVVERSAQFVQDRSLGVETDGGIQWSPGPRSFAYVPLVHRSFLHGVLAVAAAGPDAFGDRERAVLDELGKSIGAAIGAAQRKRALFAPDAVELEFEIASEDSFLVELSSDIDGPLEVDRILETTRDALRLVVTAPGLNDDGVDAVASRSTTVRSIHSVEGHEMGYEVTVERSPLFDYLLEHGIILGGMVAEDGRCRATLELPDTADVRRCVSLVESAYGRASMVARRERPDGSTSERFRATVPDRLTDRQREVLRTAHEAGFFHWPREHTGEELAARLGITQSTFLEHLRTSERRVFEVLFGAGD